MEKVLILGGTGFVGRHVCEKLAQLQCRATVATRRYNNARHLQVLPLVDVVEVDAHDSVSLAPLLAGHEAVVNLIAILHGTEAAFDKVRATAPGAGACLRSQRLAAHRPYQRAGGLTGL